MKIKLMVVICGLYLLFLIHSSVTLRKKFDFDEMFLGDLLDMKNRLFGGQLLILQKNL